MRNTLIRLGGSILVLAVTLSSGAAYARITNPNWPYTSPYSTAGSNRTSSIDDNSYGPNGRSSEFDRATRLMDRAIKEKDKGNFAKACKLANQATDIVSHDSTLGGSTMESNYAAFAAEVCDAAVKA